jgi:hypothetical protein
MVPSNLRMAYIYQIIVGIICLLAMLINSEKMIILFALMGLRPFIIGTKTVRDMTPYWRFGIQTAKISIVITVITLIILIISYQMLESSALVVGLSPGLLLSMTIPAFLIIHGMVALNFLKQSGLS